MESRRFVILISLVLATAAFAVPPPQIIETAKHATALVDVNSQEFGTAFCIHPLGFFATNSHVVQSVGVGGEVTLVLHPSERFQRVLRARVVRTDPKADLALLLASQSERLLSLNLAGTDALTETAPVTAFGYPFATLVA